MSLDRYFDIVRSASKNTLDAMLNMKYYWVTGNAALAIQKIDSHLFLHFLKYPNGSPRVWLVFEMQPGNFTGKHLIEAWQRRSHGLHYLKGLYRQFFT